MDWCVTFHTQARCGHNTRECNKFCVNPPIIIENGGYEWYNMLSVGGIGKWN